MLPVVDPGFPRGAPTPGGGGANLLVDQFFTAWKPQALQVYRTPRTQTNNNKNSPVQAEVV